MILYRQRAAIVLFDYLSSYNSNKIFFIPVNICPVVPFIFQLKNIQYEFIDIDNSTLCIQESSIIEKVKNKPNKYGGILFNHSYGTLYSPYSFFKELKDLDPGFNIIDDRCLCIPEIDFEPSELVNLTLFSTGYSKIVNLGFGGYGYIINPNYIDSVRHKDSSDLLLNLDEACENFKKKILSGEKISIGKDLTLNGSEPETNWSQYQTLIYNELNISLEQRNNITNIYKENLDSRICLNDEFQQWRFNIVVENKTEILSKLFDNKLFASSHYEPLVNFQERKFFPNATNLSNKIINLFIDKYYTIEAALKTSNIINQLR